MNMTAEQNLRRLADIYGVETSYRDVGGGYP